MVILQGLFGGITVLFFLPPPVSIIHGILAQTFFMITIVLAYGLSIERSKRTEISGPSGVKRGAVIMCGLVYVQLILGALMRHTASGMAIPDFPTMGGLWIPTFSETMIHNINSTLFDSDIDPGSKGQEVIHFIHRLGAIIVTGSIGFFGYKYGSFVKENKLAFAAMVSIIGIVILQFSLGAITVLSERSPYIASFHVVTGAALLGACTLFILRTHPMKWMDWRNG
jgi:cytochrome c oxidase assembly protein subunit 15